MNVKYMKSNTCIPTMEFDYYITPQAILIIYFYNSLID